jgi:hypothetical protein
VNDVAWKAGMTCLALLITASCEEQAPEIDAGSGNNSGAGGAGTTGSAGSADMTGTGGGPSDTGGTMGTAGTTSGGAAAGAMGSGGSMGRRRRWGHAGRRLWRWRWLRRHWWLRGLGWGGGERRRCWCIRVRCSDTRSNPARERERRGRWHADPVQR